MNKKSFVVLVFIIAIFALLVYLIYPKSNEPQMYEIPEQNITYTRYEIGNVIDEGKQAVFLCFKSDYEVASIEFAGELLDITGKTIYTFDSSLIYSSPTKNPRPAVRIDANLIEKVHSVSFSKIKAYTNQEIMVNK